MLHVSRPFTVFHPTNFWGYIYIYTYIHIHIYNLTTFELQRSVMNHKLFEWSLTILEQGGCEGGQATDGSLPPFMEAAGARKLYIRAGEPVCAAKT